MGHRSRGKHAYIITRPDDHTGCSFRADNPIEAATKGARKYGIFRGARALTVEPIAPAGGTRQTVFVGAR